MVDTICVRLGRKLLRVGLCGMLGLLMESCISKSTHQLPQAAIWPGRAEASPQNAIFYFFTTENNRSLLFRIEHTVVPDNVSSEGKYVPGIFEEEFVTALQKSGQVGSVNRGVGGDLFLKCHFNFTEYPDPLSQMGQLGMLFLVIPLKDERIYKLTVLASGSEREPKEYVLEDGVIETFWAPYLFVMPFRPSTRHLDEKVRANLYATLFHQLQKDGWFEDPHIPSKNTEIGQPASNDASE